jgi:hypothetical protein
VRSPLRVPTRALARAGLVGVVALGIAAVPAASAWSSAGGAARSGAVGVRSDEPGDKPGTRPGAPKPPDEPGQPRPAGRTPAPKDLPQWPFGPLLHGTFTVDIVEHGAVEAVAQRGVVTAVGDGTLTVTSSDGSAQTWTIGPSTHLVPVGPRRGRQAPSAVVGAPVGVWGTGTASAATAVVVVLVRALPPGSDDAGSAPKAPAPQGPRASKA